MFNANQPVFSKALGVGRRPVGGEGGGLGWGVIRDEGLKVFRLCISGLARNLL